MNFFKEYALSIVVVSLLGILLENILPEGNNKKYISIMIGLIITLVILKPLTKLPHYKEIFTIPYMSLTDDDLSQTEKRPYVAEAFEKNLALSISEMLHDDYGKTVSCRVRCAINEEGQITEVSKISLDPYSEESAAIISEKYGFLKEIVGP